MLNEGGGEGRDEGIKNMRCEVQTERGEGMKGDVRRRWTE